jgi:hypothetical protein
MGNFLKSKRTFEVLQKKRRVSSQLHIFLKAEFLKLKVFSDVGLERSCKNKSEAVLNTPI